MFDDLREFIKKAENIGEYQALEDADWDLEIGALTELLGEASGGPLLLFDKIKDYQGGYRVVTNAFNSLRRTALGLGLSDDGIATGMDLVRRYREKVANGVKLMPPEYVDSGPIKENIITGPDIDLMRFPVPKWHELDGGRYIGTGSVTIARDPDSGWINLGTYRAQVHDRDTVGVNAAPGRHMDIICKKYWEKGQSCPAAIVCGQEPILFATSAFDVPTEVSEYDYAGGLKGAPIVVTKGLTTDLPIPATAEIVLEGEILPPEVETREEGPFGEWAGYYAKGITGQPVMKVKAILHRDNPIILGCPPFVNPGAYSIGRHIQTSAAVWDELDGQIPGVKGVYNLEAGAAKSIMVVSLKQQYGGHAKQAGMLVAASRKTQVVTRFVIVVDEDIDPSNISEVLWALGTRVEPDKAIDIISGCWGLGSNPTLSPERRDKGDFTHSIAIVLACRPYAWINEFPPSVKSSPELIARTRKKFAWLF